jgi:dihydrofolate synthase/folylpolyglutamate synthase
MVELGDRCFESRLAALYERRTFGIKPGLAATEEVLEALGNPQRQMAVVHIAGTNGKGSVAAMVAAVLRQSGLCVGLYTSPHLLQFGERFQINGEPVSVEALEPVLDRVLAAEASCGRVLTFFECATAMCWLLFRERGVRLAVVETGLGGRLDATNVVDPLVSVVTRIGVDHAQWLGEGVAAIAGEKAGIIKRGRPVVCAPQEPEALVVLRQAAEAKGCRLIEATEHVSVALCEASLDGQVVRVSSTGADYGRVRLPLVGEWQLENLSVAVAAVEAVCDRVGVTLEPEVLRAGVGQVRWPGRLERVAKEPTVLFDAAHNPLAARVLVHALQRLGVRKVAWVVGMCADKDVRGVLRELHHLDGMLTAVPIPDERGMPPLELAALAQAAGHVVDSADSLAEAMARVLPTVDGSSSAEAVVVCGSIFLLQDAYQWLGRAPYA